MDLKIAELAKTLIKQTINKIIHEGNINLEDDKKLKDEVKIRLLSMYQANISEKIMKEIQEIEENFDVIFDSIYSEMNNTKINTNTANTKTNTIQQKADFYNRSMEKSANKSIEFTPIYNGKWGKVPPKRSSYEEER